jgi:hypothetical protein
MQFQQEQQFDDFSAPQLPTLAVSQSYSKPQHWSIETAPAVDYCFA